MENEQTNKIDTAGNETDKPVENEGSQTPAESQEEEYKKLKERNDKIQEELIRGEKLKTESLLSGEGGGHIENKELSEEDKKKKQAGEFFKDTALGDAIVKSTTK